MTEMNRVSRFFVNLSSGRRSRRRYLWVRKHVSLPEGATCLEIGCGNGDFALRFVEGFRPSRLVATDLDPRQIDAARRHLTERTRTGLPPALELRRADMLELPFPSASLDATFAFTAIHHASPRHRDFTKVPVALGEIDRTLKAGGLLVYEEIVHKERIRGWLTEHGYSVLAMDRRWTRESVIARKGPVGSGP